MTERIIPVDVVGPIAHRVVVDPALKQASGVHTPGLHASHAKHRRTGPEGR